MFRRVLKVTIGITLWVTVVVGAALAEARWLWRPSVPRGALDGIEKHLVGKLSESAARRRLGSGALVLVQSGRIAAEHGFGVANAAAGTPVSTERTLYLLASVSKAVTSWGVMKLVQEGRAGLDEPAIRYLKRWRFPGSEAYRERVTVRRFADYMKDAVLGPLGMPMSSFDLGAIEAEGRFADVATSYDASLNPHPTRRYAAQAAVALYATARDVAQFARAYTGANPVLRPETFESMMEPQAGTSGSWGLGQTLYARNGAGGYVVGHDGGTLPASGAVMRVNPATGNAIVLMCSGGRPRMSGLADDWVYWETGVVTWESRRQRFYNWLLPAAAAILLGAAGIVWLEWRSRNDSANAAISLSRRVLP